MSKVFFYGFSAGVVLSLTPDIIMAGELQGSARTKAMGLYAIAGLLVLLTLWEGMK